jgi:hypothetical protein
MNEHDRIVMPSFEVMSMPSPRDDRMDAMVAAIMAISNIPRDLTYDAVVDWERKRAATKSDHPSISWQQYGF